MRTFSNEIYYNFPGVPAIAVLAIQLHIIVASYNPLLGGLSNQMSNSKKKIYMNRQFIPVQISVYFFSFPGQLLWPFQWQSNLLNTIGKSKPWYQVWKAKHWTVDSIHNSSVVSKYILLTLETHLYLVLSQYFNIIKIYFVDLGNIYICFPLNIYSYNTSWYISICWGKACHLSEKFENTPFCF